MRLPVSMLKHGDIRVSVEESLTGRKRQHFMLSFGKFSEATEDECMATWPRESIAEARRQLDEFEKTIDQGR